MMSEMEGTYTITPTIIRRWETADEVEVASFIADDGRRALLVFANVPAAEAFRAETGTLLEADVEEVDLFALRNVVEMFGFGRVALVGLEQGVTSLFDAADFLGMLEGLD